MDRAELSERTAHFLRALYEEGAPLTELLRGADDVDFSWIGADRKECFDGPETLIRWWDREQKDTDRPRLRVTDLVMEEQDAGESAAAVLAAWRLTGNGNACRQRGTFVYRLRAGRWLLSHVHISQPWALVWGDESFPVTAARMNGEYLADLREEEPPLPAQVPAKQRRVLRCLRQGLTYKEIGEVLGISPRTVRYYVSELIHRFHVENKVQLLAVSRGVDEPLDERKKEDE